MRILPNICPHAYQQYYQCGHNSSPKNAGFVYIYAVKWHFLLPPSTSCLPSLHPGICCNEVHLLHQMSDVRGDKHKKVTNTGILSNSAEHLSWCRVYFGAKKRGQLLQVTSHITYSWNSLIIKIIFREK